MGATRTIFFGVFLALLALPGTEAVGQGTPPQKQRPKVRKHRVPVEEVVSPAVLQAEAAMEKQDFTTAERLLLEAVQANANDYRAWFDLGFVLNNTGRREEAVAAYRRSVAARPDIFESNLNLGILLAEAGHPEAESFLRAATRLKPSAKAEEGLARAWISLGRTMEDSQPEQALVAYREASTLRPQDPEPHLSAGALLDKQGQVVPAEVEFRKAADLDAKPVEALAALINLYTRTKRLAEAEASLRRYLEIEPDNATVRVQLGRVLLAQGRKEEALAELKAGLEASREDPDALRELAALHLAADQYQEAARYYSALVAKFPRDAELHHALGVAWMRLRKYPEAQRELLAALELKPDLAEAYGDLAVTASENKDYTLTLRALEARARYLPESPATYYLRATSYDHLRAPKEAAEQYRRFLSVAEGKFPDLEWKARHRLIALEGGKK